MSPRADRFTRNARTRRSTVSVRRSGRPAVVPGGSDARISSSKRARPSSERPGGQHDVDAVEPADLPERLLRGGEVHEDDRSGGRARRADGAQDGGDAKRALDAVRDEAERAAGLKRISFCEYRSDQNGILLEDGEDVARFARVLRRVSLLGRRRGAGLLFSK